MIAQPKDSGKSTMDAMFNLQSQLMKEYQKIEGLPDWPLDIQIKENQKLLRNFGLRFITELGESFHELRNAYYQISSNKKVEAQNSIKQFNAELGDCMAFLLEIMIFSGIQEAELQQWMEGFNRENEGYSSMLNPEDIMGSLVNYGNFQNIQEGMDLESQKNMFEILTLKDIFLKNNHEWLGGRKVSETYCDTVSQFYWWIVFTLTQALNKLKSKDWTQAEGVSNEIAFKEGILGTFILFIQLLQFLDKRELSTYKTYWLTYTKNMERIKGGY